MLNPIINGVWIKHTFILVPPNYVAQLLRRRNHRRLLLYYQSLILFEYPPTMNSWQKHFESIDVRVMAITGWNWEKNCYKMTISNLALANHFVRANNLASCEIVRGNILLVLSDRKQITRRPSVGGNFC